MERVRTTELAAHVGREVCLLGRLHALRRMGGVNFLILRDGRGIAQAVVEDEAALAPPRALAHCGKRNHGLSGPGKRGGRRAG